MVQGNGVKNILTVDVEEAFHRNDLRLSRRQRELLGGRVVEQTERVVSLLRAAGQRGTFFVLGEVAERYPVLVKRLAAEGLEVGLHGYAHGLVYRQREGKFVRETRAAKVLLEKLAGRKIVGFRAPSWSITRRSLWALKILAALGFRYDSSILPAKAYLGGMPRSNPLIHRRREADIIEVPPSIFRLGPFRLPFSGGLYLRTLPYGFVRHCIARLNKKGIPAVIYLHPWELDTGLPRLELSWKGRYAVYHNLGTAQAKVEQLLAEFSFAPVCEVLNDAYPLCRA
jgi:polysaccharide deacetylase family protein (PEP-CTERM system associated)